MACCVSQLLAKHRERGKALEQLPPTSQDSMRSNVPPLAIRGEERVLPCFSTLNPSICLIQMCLFQLPFSKTQPSTPSCVWPMECSVSALLGNMGSMRVHVEPAEPQEKTQLA